ncbi:MAG: hypothetical protein MRJ92_07875 [Nitrospira sp.]|nr:hypothetical protein [Nitrospira sp.]
MPGPSPLTLIGDAGQSYFRIRELDEQIEIAQRAPHCDETPGHYPQASSPSGWPCDLDVKRTEVLVAESAGQIPDVTRLRAVEVHRLEVLTGASPGTLSFPDATANTRRPAGHSGRTPSHLLERRPDILQAEASPKSCQCP